MEKARPKVSNFAPEPKKSRWSGADKAEKDSLPEAGSSSVQSKPHEKGAVSSTHQEPPLPPPEEKKEGGNIILNVTQ